MRSFASLLSIAVFQGRRGSASPRNSGDLWPQKFRCHQADLPSELTREENAAQPSYAGAGSTPPESMGGRPGTRATDALARTYSALQL